MEALKRKHRGSPFARSACVTFFEGYNKLNESERIALAWDQIGAQTYQVFLAETCS